MDAKISDFLTQEHISVVAIMRKDNSVHTASLHFSHTDEPLAFYFSTERSSRKCEALLTGETVKASVVVGFSEASWLTMQMDGDIKAVLDPVELATAQAVHYAKHPGSAKYKDDPETIFLKFSPAWWRFTDFNTEPPAIMSSEK